MNQRNVEILDPSGVVLLTAQVVDEGGHFGGKLDAGSMPAQFRELFEEFEEIVNGQMFVFLDEIQERIESLGVRAVFDDEFQVLVRDLQVFPNAGNLSFKLAGVPTPITRVVANRTVGE